MKFNYSILTAHMCLIHLMIGASDRELFTELVLQFKHLSLFMRWPFQHRHYGLLKGIVLGISFIYSFFFSKKKWLTKNHIHTTKAWKFLETCYNAKTCNLIDTPHGYSRATCSTKLLGCVAPQPRELPLRYCKIIWITYA